MIRFQRLGDIGVDTGDVVCFSSEQCLKIAERLGIDFNTLIKGYGGLECNFNSDGCYDVCKVFAVQKDGETYDMVLIGGDIQNFHRFLNHDEPTIDEFVDSHPKSEEIGCGKDFKIEIFNEVFAEYRQQLLSKPKV
jgi:hypothetical protein